jgi:prevent-host-death family protein
VYFIFVNATLTELYRKPGKLARSVILGKQKLTITEHGQPCVQIIPVAKIDRKAALTALRAIGPVRLSPRK